MKNMRADPFTRADYNLLPEGFPAQLVEGMLVKEPAPTYGHNLLARRLLAQLIGLVGVERAVHAPQDVGLDDWNVYQPDVLVLREPAPLDVSDVGVPMLVIEVLAPATARRDRVVKTRHLLEAGVGEVWLIDAATATVEMIDASSRRSARGNQPISSRVVAGFEVVPRRLFSPTLSGEG